MSNIDFKQNLLVICLSFAFQTKLGQINKASCKLSIVNYLLFLYKIMSKKFENILKIVNTIIQEIEYRSCVTGCGCSQCNLQQIRKKITV